MVNQLKKDLPESQKSPFPLQTDVIPHIVGKGFLIQQYPNALGFTLLQVNLIVAFQLLQWTRNRTFHIPHIYLSRFRSIHLSGILDVKAYRNPASPRLLNTQITIFKTTV